MSLCNFQLTSPKVDGVYSWQKGLASLSTWLGGPSKDASNSSDGIFILNLHHPANYRQSIYMFSFPFISFRFRSITGGYVFFETSSLSVQQLPGVQAKAWLKRYTKSEINLYLHFTDDQFISLILTRLLRLFSVPCMSPRRQIVIAFVFLYAHSHISFDLFFKMENAISLCYACIYFV